MTSEAKLTAPDLSVPKLETVHIRAGASEARYWQDLLSYREVLYFMAWRDVLVRYKQAVFGIAWAVLRPLLTMLVFTLVFGRLGKFPSYGMPYPMMVFAGLWPWLFFATSSLEASNSLIANQNLVSKTYFPRLLVPLAPIGAAITDFLFASVIMLGLMVIFGVMPTWRLIVIPPLFLVAAVTAASIGIWFSALNVKFRDFRFVLPVILQLGLYMSPVGFAARIVPDKWQFFYSLNPMVTVIQGFRWAVFPQALAINWPGFITSLFIVLTLLITGLIHFRATEKTMADWI